MVDPDRRRTGRPFRDLAVFCYRTLAQVADPLRAARGLRAIGWFLSDYRRYRRLPGAEPLSLADVTPAFHERDGAHEIDTHYFFVNAWAMRRVSAARPAHHFDFASQITLAAQLSAIVPVTYIDYRPLNVRLDGLNTVAGDLLRLPFRDGSLDSMSCLHVAEHVGLGRYGDSLDPAGTLKAAAELARVLAPGGSLFFALPIGRPRLCFNAHRIHAATTVRDYFPALELAGYAGVDDRGQFFDEVPLQRFDENEYACGMFHFRKAVS
jgi:hypothetical protein